MILDQRLEAMRRRVREGEQRRWRQAAAPDVLAECEAEGLSWTRRVARLTHRQCEAERPVILADERIVFTRTLPSISPIYTSGQWAALTEGRTLHELGPISNVCADWGMVLSQGLAGRRKVAEATRARLAGAPQVAKPDGAIEFLDGALETIDAVLDLAARYANEARAQGREDMAAILDRVPAQPPRTFHEALQALRLLQAVVWLTGHYHVGLGRFDQYMAPYLEADLATGRETVESAEKLLAEFFITLNKDSDLYPGVQQGDNGQTLTVGGVKRDGSDGTNELTHMVLRVALATSMIDPKINLRISPTTRLDLLSLGTELTRKGLGFPQYSNDDVVVPALAAHGYNVEDARDYTVAACWEFIIPGKGMDIVNIGALSFPAAADRGIRRGLAEGGDMGAILRYTAEDIRSQVGALVDAYRNLLLPPAPYYSVLFDDCLETGRDLARGCKYNNYGVHGAGSADAADALAAVEQLVLREKGVAPAELLAALEANYEGHELLRARLAGVKTKVGQDSAAADDMLQKLFTLFAEACEAIPNNGRGGIVRPGTGSAMYYIWLATGHEGMREPVVGATANGRRKGAYFGANLAPAHNARVLGPTAVLESFSKIDYHRICNGGPITLELSDSVFQGDDSIGKVAQLVHTFARLGCQQMQLNTVQLDTLRAAKAHPEQYRDVIVRVWGWSAYFVDLAPEYQEHVMSRHMYSM